MSLETTTQTMNGYLDALLQRGDFGRFFTEDVLWTTMETGEELRGREPVRDLIVALHTQLFDARPELKNLAVGNGVAAVEADFIGVHIAEFAGIPATGANVRVSYAVWYEVSDAGISALRAYMPMRQLTELLQTAQSAVSTPS